MKSNPDIEIVNITENSAYERYLYKCLAPHSFRKYRKRQEYLEVAIPKGFHKKLLIFNGEIVGQIEYAPAEVSGYPIIGNDITVMNCVWVLRKVKGHNFGKQLLANMIEMEKNAVGFAAIGLENHWSGWLRKDQMEKLGFKQIDSIEVMHKTKHRGECFKMHLMWLPKTKNINPPTWNKSKLLEGVAFCMAHPLYHPEKLRLKRNL
jgi:ribosomal protein S18 acetylase RimI-like enzyme